VIPVRIKEMRKWSGSFRHSMAGFELCLMMQLLKEFFKLNVHLQLYFMRQNNLLEKEKVAGQFDE
jgi:hypothetical protein